MGVDKTAEAMTQSVIAPTDVTWKSDDIKMLENKLITVDVDGYYYFGLHAISDKDEYFLHVNDLVVEESASLAGPDVVTNFIVVPTENKLEATISFTAPTKTVAGDDLTENLTKVDVLRDGEVIKTFEDVAPGTELSYVDNDRTLTIGAYSYQVVAYNAAGKGLTSDAITAHISVVFEVPYVADFSNEETSICSRSSTTTKTMPPGNGRMRQNTLSVNTMIPMPPTTILYRYPFIWRHANIMSLRLMLMPLAMDMKNVSKWCLAELLQLRV